VVISANTRLEVKRAPTNGGRKDIYGEADEYTTYREGNSSVKKGTSTGGQLNTFAFRTLFVLKGDRWSEKEGLENV